MVAEKLSMTGMGTGRGIEKVRWLGGCKGFEEFSNPSV